MPEITCPTCGYQGLDRARHKADCPHRSTHGGLRTEPRGGRITASVAPDRFAAWLVFKGDRTPKEAMESLIDEALRPKKPRLKKNDVSP